MTNVMGEDVLSLERLHQLFEVVFMDSSGVVNLLANLMSDEFQLVIIFFYS